MKQYERQTGETPEELIPPREFPYLLNHIWSAFSVLSDTRSFGVNGPNPISFEQIDAWVRLTNQVIRPRDIEAIIALDRVYLKVKYG